MTPGDDLIDRYLSAWSRLPDLIVSWLRKIIAVVLHIALLVGVILIVWGAIEWATALQPREGRRKIVRGVALIVLSLAPVLVGV